MNDALRFDEDVRKARLLDSYPTPGVVALRLTWPQTELLRDMLDFAEAEYYDGRDRAMARRIRVNLNRVEIATLSVEGLQDLEVSPQRRLTGGRRHDLNPVVSSAKAAARKTRRHHGG